MNQPRGFAALLAELDLPRRVRADLIRRMGEPWRGYHGMRHLAVLWARHRRFARGRPMRGPRLDRLIAAVIGFHDAVLVPGAADNERRSAALWRGVARRLRRYSPAEIAWVAETILATADHLGTPVAPGVLGRARSWVLDLDLTPIGESAVEFRRNGRGLRAEARHLDDATYDSAQLGFLLRLEKAPSLYRDERLRTVFEARARSNIKAEALRAASRAAGRRGRGGG